MEPKRKKVDKGDNYTFAGKPRDSEAAVGFMEKLNIASFEHLEELNKIGR